MWCLLTSSMMQTKEMSPPDLAKYSSDPRMYALQQQQKLKILFIFACFIIKRRNFLRFFPLIIVKKFIEQILSTVCDLNRSKCSKFLFRKCAYSLDYFLHINEIFRKLRTTYFFVIKDTDRTM